MASAVPSVLDNSYTPNWLLFTVMWLLHGCLHGQSECRAGERVEFNGVCFQWNCWKHQREPHIFVLDHYLLIFRESRIGVNVPPPLAHCFISLSPPLSARLSFLKVFLANCLGDKKNNVVFLLNLSFFVVPSHCKCEVYEVACEYVFSYLNSSN